MARKTRFNTDDLVKVRYRTTALSGSYIGKVIQYNSERRQYLVAVLAQASHVYRDTWEPVPAKNSIWCRVAELSFATDDEINYVKGMDHVGVSKDFMTKRLKTLYNRPVNSRALSRMLLHAYKLGLSIPKDMDNLSTYRPLERWQYLRSFI